MENKKLLNRILFAMLAVFLGMISIGIKGAESFSFLATVAAVISASNSGIKMNPYLIIVLIVSIITYVIAILAFDPNGARYHFQVTLILMPFWVGTTFTALLLPEWKKDFT